MREPYSCAGFDSLKKAGARPTHRVAIVLLRLSGSVSQGLSEQNVIDLSCLKVRCEGVAKHVGRNCALQFRERFSARFSNRST